MNTPPAPSRLSRRILKWLLWLASILLLLILLLGITIFFIPKFVSTDWFKDIVEEKTSRFLQHPVSIDDLSWSWSEGIILTGLKIDDDPEFSTEPLLLAKSITVTFVPVIFNAGPSSFALDIIGVKASLIRDSEGRTNLDFLIAPPSEPQVVSKEPGNKGRFSLKLPIPFNLRGHVAIQETSLLIQDHRRDQTFKASDIELRLESKSFLESPIDLSLSTKEEIDNIPLEPVRLTGHFENLINTQGLILPDKMIAEIEGKLPGTSFDLRGIGDGSSILLNLRMELTPLLQTVQPFLNSDLPDATGTIIMHGEISADLGDEINFQTRVDINTLMLTNPSGQASIGPVDLEAVHDGSLDLSSMNLNITSGRINLKDNTHLSWNGNTVLKDTHPTMDMRVESMSLDLANLNTLTRDLIPEGMEVPDVKGSVELKGDISLDSGGTFSFDTILEGKELSASGGSLKSGLGPINVRAAHQGSFNPDTGTAKIDFGEIRLSESLFQWNGVVKNLKDPETEMSIGMGPIKLDLNELYQVAGKFLPADLPVAVLAGKDLSTDRTAQTGISLGELGIDELKINGTLKPDIKRVELSNLDLSIPSYFIKNSPLTLSGTDLDIRLNRSDILLDSNFPSRAEISLSVGMKNIHANTGKDILIEKLQIPSLKLLASDIRPSSGAFFGVSGKVHLTESLNIRDMSVPSYAKADEISHSMETECIFEKGPTLAVDTALVSINAPLMHIMKPLPGPLKTNLQLDAEMGGFRFNKPISSYADFEKASVLLTLGEMLKARLNARTGTSDSQKFSINGQMDLDLKTLSSLIPADYISGVNLTGTNSIGWEFTGRLPEKDELNRIKLKDFSFRERLKEIDFIDNLLISSTLDDVSITLPIDDRSSINLSRIHTIKPLQFNTENGVQHTSIVGDISFGQIKELPYVGSLKKPATLAVNFSLDQADLKTIRFSETAHLMPMKIEHSLNVHLNNIHHLLNNRFEDWLSLILENMEGKVSTEISVETGPDLADYLDEVSINGLVKAGGDINLVKKEEIGTRLWLRSKDLNADLESKVKVSNLKANLDIDKEYIVTRTGSADLSPATESRLSEKVLNPVESPRSMTGSQDAFTKRLMDDLKGRLTSEPSLAFDSLIATTLPIPVEITDHELRFRLINGLPQIDHFQMNMMGGTLIGDLSIKKSGETFVLETRTTFSGLNTNNLLRQSLNAVQEEDSEITGKVLMTLPLSPDSRQMLKDLSLIVDITHIGAKTLDRFLYALDPYESNEAVLKQRKLLQIGSPRWVRLDVQYGNLSVSGQVRVKSVSVDLPRIDRINLIDLPIHRQLDEGLSNLGSAINILKIISADSIEIGNDGIIWRNK